MSTAHVMAMFILHITQVTHGKQKIASIQGFVSQEKEKYEKMVSLSSTSCDPSTNNITDKTISKEEQTVICL